MQNKFIHTFSQHSSVYGISEAIVGTKGSQCFHGFYMTVVRDGDPKDAVLDKAAAGNLLDKCCTQFFFFCLFFFFPVTKDLTKTNLEEDKFIWWPTVSEISVPKWQT